MPDGLTARRSVLVTTDAVGGVWRYALTLAEGMAARGIGTVLAVMGPPPDAGQRAECCAVPGLRLVETGLPLDWTASHASELTGATARLIELAALEGVSGVHLHAPALVGGTAWPVPAVAVSHSCVATWWAGVRGGPMPPDFEWRTTLAQNGLRAASAVIAPSAAHAAALRATYGIRDVHVVHNGGHVLLGNGVRRRAVLTAGRLWDEGKDAARLDRAAAGLDAPVWAAGPARGPNGAAAAFNHLELLGALDRSALADRYAAASVFASFARYEPFGLAVLEAAQAGCALVLSDMPTFRELWDGAAVFVSPDADPVPALRRALDDAARLGALARARAARYHANATVDGTLAVHRHAALAA